MRISDWLEGKIVKIGEEGEVRGREAKPCPFARNIETIEESVFVFGKRKRGSRDSLIPVEENDSFDGRVRREV